MSLRSTVWGHNCHDYRGSPDHVNSKLPLDVRRVEFVATSITSGGDGFDTNDRSKALHVQDPHIKFLNNQRGYGRHVVTPDHWQADFQVLDKVSVGDGQISPRKSVVVEHGKNHLAEV
jgi:alkaline phosphatase D